MIFNTIFPNTKPIIGMIHVPALPGTPKSTLSMPAILDIVLNEARLYAEMQLDSIMIENMNDVPYLNKSVGPEITAFMSVIGDRIKHEVGIPCGMQILAAANNEALSAALAAGFDFIRAEGFVYGHLADEGYINSCAGELMRYRKKIGADQIAIFTDIKKKHSSHAITSDVDIAETAKSAEFFLSDGLIITGIATGMEADLKEISMVRKVTNLPIIIGSGISIENIEKYWDSADGFIIGSYFKEEGIWDNSVSTERVKEFMRKIKYLSHNSGQTPFK
jgi:uncharacterized protein